LPGIWISRAAFRSKPFQRSRVLDELPLRRPSMQRITDV
jgi:hypothetical protein